MGKKGCIGEGHAVPVGSENDSLDRRQSSQIKLSMESAWRQPVKIRLIQRTSNGPPTRGSLAVHSCATRAPLMA